MRVFYTARQSGPSAPVVYRQGRVKFCCASLARWWGLLIGFGVRDCPASTSRDVCLYLDRPQASRAPVLELVPVECCPWCGEVVEAVREK
jgi:hypothetical protein